MLILSAATIRVNPRKRVYSVRWSPVKLKICPLDKNLEIDLILRLKDILDLEAARKPASTTL